MSIIDAEGEFLERQAVETLPSLEKEIYKDMITAEIYQKHNEKAVKVVADWHNMTEKEVTECMLRVYEFIEEYIQQHKGK